MMKVFYLIILIGFSFQYAMAANFTHPVDPATLKELEGQWKFIGFSCKIGKDHLNMDYPSFGDTVFNADGTVNISTKKGDCEVNYTGPYTASLVDTGALVSEYSGRQAPPRLIEGKLIVIEYEEDIIYRGSCPTISDTKARDQITIMLHNDGHFYLSDTDLSEDICEKGSGYFVFKKQ